MRKTRRSNWLRIKVLALALAAAAVVPSVARAELPKGYAPGIEAELAMIEAGSDRSGVSPNTASRAHVPPRYEGVAAPDGFQPQLSGSEPLVIRGMPDGAQPQLSRAGGETVFVSDNGRVLDRVDVAIYLSLGLALVAAFGLALAMTRGRVRLAH
jgi:hypothetical protein